MGAPIRPSLPKLTIPSFGKPVGDAAPAAKGSPGSAAAPSASSSGLTTRSSQGGPAPRSAKPQWASGASPAATVIASRIRSRENIAMYGALPFKDGVGKGGDGRVDEWELDSPVDSPATSPASSTSERTAVGDGPRTPAAPGTPLSGTTLAGSGPSSPTSATPAAGGQPAVVAQAVPTAKQDPAGGQAPVDGKAESTVLSNPASGEPSGGGSKTAAAVGAAAAAGVAGAGAAALAGKVLPKGSGAQGVAQALNPLSNSPTANAAGNLADVVKPDVGDAMQKLSTDAQANQMAGVGSDTGKWAKVQQQTLTHNNNEDAVGAMKDSAGSVKTDIAMKNTATTLQNADSFAKMVASFARKTGKTADEIAQGN